LRVGLVSEEDIRPEYELMRHSNRSAANGLITQLERAPESVRQVTDVSGFGLIGALRTICGPSIVELDSEQLPRTSNASRFIREQAWSALADANLRDSEGFAEYGSGAKGGEVAVLANDPQTSGGLLAIVTADAAVQLTSIADLGFVDIGVIGAIDEEPMVRITPGGDRT
jgi:selenophosphate synthase